MKCQFGVVFHAKSNGKVNVQISWYGRRPLHNFATTGGISRHEGSILESFSCPNHSLMVRNLAQLIPLYSGSASIFPKAAPFSSVHNEINGLTLHLPQVEVMLSLRVRNLVQLVLLYSGPASIFPKQWNQWIDLLFTWGWDHAEFGGAQPYATSTFV